MTPSTPAGRTRPARMVASFRALPGGWQVTVAVLTLLTLLGVSSPGDSSDASVEVAAVESENAELQRRLDVPAATETVTERVTERVTETVERPASPGPTITATATETVTEIVTEAAAAPAPAPLPAPPQAALVPAGECSPEYSGACVPMNIGNVNCPDVAAQDFRSVGSDPYGLDGDTDGIACES